MNVIIILGPTAVGKSALGIRLAKKIGGEIISCDATQIYRGLDIGSAKISAKEMCGIPHHMIDIKNFAQTFNAFVFVESAKKLIDEIILRGKTPIIVGGTNLYISALVKGYNFEKSGKNDLPYKNKFPLDFYLFALNVFDRAELYEKINKRVDIMLERGLVEEVKRLKLQGLTLEHQAGKGIGYRELLQWLDGQMEFDEAVEKIKQHSRNFAKRQLTWLRGMPEIIWLDAHNDNLEIVLKKLNNK